MPPTYHANTLNFSDQQLDGPQKCLCGQDVKLRDCMVCWTHVEGTTENAWFAACNATCITARVVEGHA